MISPAMSTEERLRAATRAAADTVPPGSAPPLRLPDDPAAGPLRGGGSRRHRWLRALTPLAAAAAVVIVLAGALTVAVAHIQPGHGLRAPPGHGGAAAQLPPYYVTLHGQLGDATHAQSGPLRPGRSWPRCSRPAPTPCLAR